MAQFPAYFAFKTLGLTGTTRGYLPVTSKAGLEEAEFQAAPGSWKLFPYTTANQTTEAEAAAKWAGAPYTGTGGTGGETIPAPVQNPSSVLGLPTLSHLRDLMIRVMKVAVGAALVIIGVAQLTDAKKLIDAVPKVVPV
jgi:hypothetical protein